MDTENLVRCAYCGEIYDSCRFCCPRCQQQAFEELTENEIKEINEERR